MSNDASNRFGRINTRVIERVTNLALYGMRDEEILVTMRPEINCVTVTARWVRFLAAQARRENGIEAME